MQLTPPIDRKRIYCKYYGIGCPEQKVEDIAEEYGKSSTHIYDIVDDERNEPTIEEFEKDLSKNGFNFEITNDRVYHVFKPPYHSLYPNSRFYYKNYERYQKHQKRKRFRNK